jgi:hypothetical protein
MQGAILASPDGIEVGVLVAATASRAPLGGRLTRLVANGSEAVAPTGVDGVAHFRIAAVPPRTLLLLKATADGCDEPADLFLVVAR